MKPRLLDLFCGAGGAAMGYSRAGFEVVGVDIKPQPRYPFTFIRADAIDFPTDGYEVIHASPPCQAYSATKGLTTKTYPKLIEPIREKLKSAGKPYVIENVVGAPLIHPTLLCGGMFDILTWRHRLFECNPQMPLILHRSHGAYGDKLTGPARFRRRKYAVVVGHAQYAGAKAIYQKAMGINWMTQDELAEAIPPAYTLWIGTQLLKALGTAHAG